MPVDVIFAEGMAMPLAIGGAILAFFGGLIHAILCTMRDCRDER